MEPVARPGIDLLAVGIGGALGAILRYTTTQAVARLDSLPAYAPVFGVNMVGSFLIGVLAAGLSTSGPGWSLFLMTGVLGGFTTFSSFSLDNMRLIREGHWGPMLTNVLAQCVLGVLLCAAGYALAGRLWPGSSGT